MRNATVFLASALSVLVPLSLPGCGNDPAQVLTVGTGPLKVQTTEWNNKQVPVGQVASVVDMGNDVVVFGSQGVMLFTSGLLLATDPSVQMWRDAALIPAGDLSGQWAAGVDAKGHVYRLRNSSLVEDVTDRYGLLDAPVRGLAALSMTLSAFLLDQKLAVADGQTVVRYDGDFTGLSGGGGRAAAVGPDVIRVMNPGKSGAQVQVFPVPGAVAVTFDANGKLVVAARDSLYQEGEGGVLDRVYQSDTAHITGLAQSGGGTWVAMGDTVGLLMSRQLLIGPAGQVPAGTRLLGSPSGDVWALAGGKLTRLSQDVGSGPDVVLWKTTVKPVFDRICSLCHLPGGVSGIDLSTYPSWSARRALVGMRVIDGKPTRMPPAGAGTLTAGEMDAIKKWVASSAN